jgi:NitT/TauT family transport system substrate-binding protein
MNYIRPFRFFAAALIAVFIMFSVCAEGGKDTRRKENVSFPEKQDEVPVLQEHASSSSAVPVQPVFPTGGEVHIGILNGPTSIPAAYMVDTKPLINGRTVVFDKYATPQALLPKMLKGETDIGFMPANIAAKVYNSAAGALLCAGISGNGNLYLITKDRGIKTLADLAGKTVSVAGQGATPEYMLRWILAQNRIPTDIQNGVKLDYTVPTPDIAAELLSDKIKYAVVPEPFATVALMKSKDIVRALDLQYEFGAIEGKNATYPLTVMVISKSIAEHEPETVRAFISAYNDSLAWTIANPQKAGVLVQKYTLGLMAPVVANAVPYSCLVWKNAVDSKNEIERLLSIFLEFAPVSIGGKLPDEGFYFQ